MALLVKASGEQLLVLPENKQKFSLTELQNYVGGMIEVLRTQDKVFIFNENGLGMNLPNNEYATALLYAEIDGFKPIQILVGDVLVCEHSEKN